MRFSYAQDSSSLPFIHLFQLPPPLPPMLLEHSILLLASGWFNLEGSQQEPTTRKHFRMSNQTGNFLLIKTSPDYL
ncbi:uncharacterized protein METZ01_LOCUS251816 [marine metagenome]|uniref:Uncharacterized protein n=1 Tax=marine metagenome TaxID=408172 RepID=A0A382II57_9ZZZZ